MSSTFKVVLLLANIFCLYTNCELPELSPWPYLAVLNRSNERNTLSNSFWVCVGGTERKKSSLNIETFDLRNCIPNYKI